jgi:hypothetical protein
MAAWTLPAMIADWCEILISVLDRRSRKYFFKINSGNTAWLLPQNGVLLAARCRCFG